MEQFITTIPHSIPGAVVGAATIFTAFAFIRRNDLKLLRETNDDLRQAHGDNQEKIALMAEQIKVLQIELAVLKKSNKTLGDLVQSALVEYFKKNPKAVSVATIIK
jgi:hypothetical protein